MLPDATPGYPRFQTMQVRSVFPITGCTGKRHLVSAIGSAVNRWVAGSNPARGAKEIKRLLAILRFQIRIKWHRGNSEDN